MRKPAHIGFVVALANAAPGEAVAVFGSVFVRVAAGGANTVV